MSNLALDYDGDVNYEIDSEVERMEVALLKHKIELSFLNSQIGDERETSAYYINMIGSIKELQSTINTIEECFALGEIYDGEGELS